MEYENTHGASKGVAGAGLGLGIAGTALGLMAGGLNGTGLFNGNCNRNGCGEDTYVSRYETTLNNKIAELETEVKLRDSNIYTHTYTDGKILDLYKYVDGKFGCIENQLAEQRVYNATNTATIACLTNQVNALAALTKVVIPIGNVCPLPQAATTTPTTGA